MSNFKFDPATLLTGLTEMPSKFDRAVRAYAETGAQMLVSSAKENRPWQDRTSHARQRLNGSVSKISNGYRIYLSHGVDYGIWLELANEKRYSIIPKTIEYVGTFQIMPGFEKLMERLGSG